MTKELSNNQQESIAKLYEFLSVNHTYNDKLQKSYYHDWLFPHQDAITKIRSVFYKVVNSQSQPKIDPLSCFWERFNSISDKKKYIEKDKLNLKLFMEDLLSCKFEDNGFWKTICFSLQEQKGKGWGPKTGALASKALYIINNDTDLDFMSERVSLDNNDSIDIPVDSVMIHVFKELTESKGSKSFKSINRYMKSIEQTDPVIWDSLWFWGFITQKGSGKNRITVYNPNKLLCLENSHRLLEDFEEIKNKAEEFIGIIKK